MIRDIRGLFKITGGGKKVMLLLLLRCPFEAARTFINAIFLQSGFDAINNGNINGLYFACMIFVIESLLLFLYNGTVWTINSVYVAKWTGTLRRKLFGHISTNLSLQRVESRTSGEWFTRLNHAVYSATAILAQPVHLPFLAVGTINAAVSSVMLFRMSPEIFGLVILFVLPHMLANQIITKPIPELWRSSLMHSAHNATDFNALINCADTAILYGAQEFLMKRFEASSLNTRKTNMKIRRRFSLDGAFASLFGMCGYLVLLLAGKGWIDAGTMTFGILAAAFQCRGGIIAGAGAAITGFRQMQSSVPGIGMVNEIMDTRPED
ncbi:MAG: ABC transporter transmembrane domain-containing protein [Oscillospiraceae bacterium]|jgi:ABC-type bacteriocin/lantibiotic exporter with double-glycine peptidase domain|nr:ABC transporter transmembrane domain-containing protein [Oscillospiraceae bacterium]